MLLAKTSPAKIVARLMMMRRLTLMSCVSVSKAFPASAMLTYSLIDVKTVTTGLAWSYTVASSSAFEAVSECGVMVPRKCRRVLRRCLGQFH